MAQFRLAFSCATRAITLPAVTPLTCGLALTPTTMPTEMPKENTALRHTQSDGRVETETAHAHVQTGVPVVRPMGVPSSLKVMFGRYGGDFLLVSLIAA